MRRPSSAGLFAAALGATLVLVLSCSNSADDGIGVTLERTANVTSRCARVYVTVPDTGEEQSTNPIVLGADEASWSVGLLRGKSLPEEVTIGARGYSETDCTGAITSTTRERTVRFSDEVEQVSLRLHVEGDEDADGHIAVEAGGDDCDDDDENVNPGQSEICGNGFDDDCSGASDCADPACVGGACANGGRCNEANVCLGSSAEADCNDGVDNDGDGLVDCADPDCEDRVCDAPSNCSATGLSCVDKRCRNAPLEGRPCDDADVCTVNDVCSFDATCGGEPRCEPRVDCEAAACAADGSCSFSPVADGTPCSIGLCTAGQCAAPFPFTPSNVPIPAPEDFTGHVNLNCAGNTPTFDSSNLTFSNWCAGAPQPAARVKTQAGGTQVVVLAMTQLTVAANVTLRLIGDKPVILAVAGDAQIDGVINAGSRFVNGLSERGAGASTSAACIGGGTGRGGLRAPQGNTLSSGGGGGGGFGTLGGRGGNSSTGGTGGAGGTSDPGSANLTPLRAGCGGGFSNSSAVSGGEGGGGVQLTVGKTLFVNGIIGTPGAGGRAGAVTNDGGGGGGSGGGIHLEAQVLVVDEDAAITANGGGGGGAHANGPSGAPGADGSINGRDPAQGGDASNGIGSRGDGGNGAAGETGATNGNDGTGGGPASGGGGGGGGMGRIVLRALGTCTLDNDAELSPPPVRAGVCGR